MNEHNHTSDPEDLINILLSAGLSEGLRAVSEQLLNTAMILERSRHIQAEPHQRTTSRTGHSNGFKPRKFQTSMGQLNLSMPQVRGSEEPFRSTLIEKGSRSDRALKAAISEMYVQGVSTRRVTKVVGELCGFDISSTSVSNLTSTLDAEFERWRNRPLPEISHLFVDATYYKSRINGAVRDCATLIAIGIQRENGKRIILGASCALSEAEVHWRAFLTSLKERGIGIPDLVTSDAHEGLKAALRATMNATPWQRCQFHLQQNAQSYISRREDKQSIAAEIRSIFDADKQSKAKEFLNNFVSRHAKSSPELASWAEENIPEGLTVFTMPSEHRKRLRTSNMCETLNSSIKRRTRVVGLFPNESALLRLVTAVIMEISDEWETGKTYLPQITTK